MSAKHILYDWLGYNTLIADFFHQLTDNALYKYCMLFASNFLGNYLFFPVHLAIATSIIAYYLHQKNKKAQYSAPTKFHSNILNFAYTLITLLVIEAILIEISKRYFSAPRPVCVITPNALPEPNCLRSFPSGHTAYAITWAISLWPIVNNTWRIITIISVILVAVSRVSLQMHYPIDVTTSAVLAVVLTQVMKRHVEKLSNLFSSANYHIINYLAKI